MFGLRQFLDDMRRGLDAIFSNQHAIVNLLTSQAQRLLMIERRLQHVDATTTGTRAQLDALIDTLPAATAAAAKTTLVPAIVTALTPILQGLIIKNGQTADVDLSSEINALQNTFPQKVADNLAATLPGEISTQLQAALGTSSSSSSASTTPAEGSAATTDGAIVPGAATTGTEPTSADAGTPAAPADGSTPAPPADGSATPSGGQ